MASQWLRKINCLIHQIHHKHCTTTSKQRHHHDTNVKNTHLNATVKETLTCHILWRPWQPGIDLKKPSYSFIPSPIITRMLNKTLSSPHRKSQFPWTLHGRSTNLPFQPTETSDYCHFVICRSNTFSAIRQCQWAFQHTISPSQTNRKYSPFPIRSLLHSIHNSPHFIVHIHRKKKITL